MSKLDCLVREITRHLRRCEGVSTLDDAAVRAVTRAVRLALSEPTPAMLRAGWGSHLNLDSELGQDFARDDYCRLIEAVFADNETSFAVGKLDSESEEPSSKVAPA